MGSLRVLLSVIVMAGILAYTEGLAVMSIDLGNEFMKIALVKPGVPMEIALNKESKRKTPVVVSMRNGERLFGDPAMVTAVKYPDQAFLYFQDLLGKTVENPMVKLYKERFPYHDIIEDTETKTVIFKHPDGSEYTPEELMAMILQNAQNIAEHFAEQPVTDAVITVPPFFNQAERRAMLRAADLSGIKVLQLMNDNTATALNYGVFRRKNFNTTAQHFLFFDTGSSSTSATVAAFQLVKNKNAVTGITDTNPQLTIKGVGYDRTLGGIEFQLRLRDHLAREFNKQKKTSTDVFTDKRAMSKLFKEAGRLKNVLSANNEHHAQVESLIEDIDFKTQVTRDEFEEMCSDLFERIRKPVEDAMKMSEVTWDEISEVILMGGGTRVPKVQTVLREVIGREDLGKSLNTDEASAMGAVYQAAHLSKGFKVKPFYVKDTTIYPIQVEFERVKSSEDGKPAAGGTVKRTLFGVGNPYPQKKVMTFNKHQNDFNFAVNYGDLSHLDQRQTDAFSTSQELHKISLAGVKKAYDGQQENSESKGVKAHFRMDESGILSLDRAEVVFERAAGVEDGEDESTLSKIGNFLFGGSEKSEDGTATTDETKDKPEGGDKPTDEKTEDKQGNEKSEGKAEKEDAKETTESQTDESESKTPETPGEEAEKQSEKAEEEEKDAAKKAGEEKTESKDDAKKVDSSDEKKNETESDKKEEKKELKPKTIKEPLTFEMESIDLQDPSKDQMKNSKKLIKDFAKRDKEKQLKEEAINNLETFIVDWQDKLWQEEYEKCSTEEERDRLRARMSESSDWLYELAEDTERKTYEDRLTELRAETRDILVRVEEFKGRSVAMEAMNNMMNYTNFFLTGMRNLTGEDHPFTEVELKTLETMYNETLEWNKTASAEQAELPLTAQPVLLIQDIRTKLEALDREIKYLVNKAKFYVPKKKKNATETADTEKKNDTEKVILEDGEDVKKNDEEQPSESEEKEDTNETKEEEETLELEAVSSDSETVEEPKKHAGHDPDDEL